MKHPWPSKPITRQWVPGWAGILLAGGAFLTLLVLETRRPLRRKQTEPKLRRNARNFAFAGISAGALQLCEREILAPFTRLAEERRWGLLKVLRLPRFVETALGFLLLDYLLYAWHALSHRAKILWRFHQVHHCDLDMDASTGARFHFGELACSIPPRAGLIVLMGISPLALSLWQTALFVSIMFHHSNVRLPLGVERLLAKLIVTPRMHGIHHSMMEDEARANLSSGLALWDILHGTHRLDVPEDEITIGVATWRKPEEVALARLAGMPFSGPPAELADGPPLPRPAIAAK